MKRVLTLALLALTSPVLAAAQSGFQLEPVLSGLSSPLYVGNAHDGSNRLFVVERGGVIKVLQPGSSTPTVFLDITARVLSGGEQGLLGLAFHPQYSSNRRFFVNYTRQPDGATVIAEYRANASNPNVADAAETPILVIARPNTNHNGGMIEFGRDGYLYIGAGDSGGANDPLNYAQNIEQLQGKVLRIDINTPNGPVPYSSPPDNPFFGATPGRDEIFATGFRNPYRFSFDRVTGQLWAGDVGQGTVEEVDIVTLGGNYGWRVFEGTLCTGLGPAPCTPSNYVMPIAEYDHSFGRCSVTGGYVYRGTLSTVPVGAYLFGDFCTGEIYALQAGAAFTILADTTLNISSFGEDEAGELYVVNLNGTLHRLRNTNPPPTPAPGQVLISELRFRGPAGAEDEFVEIYNNTGAAINVSTTDGSAGWALVASDGATRFIIPNGTPIPARGHFLVVNSDGYSLGSYPAGNGPASRRAGRRPSPAPAPLAFAPTATGDAAYTADISDRGGVALFATANPANFNASTRLDAFGLDAAGALYSEGTPHPPVGSAGGEFTLSRRFVNSLPQDTGNNAADFQIFSTAGALFNGIYSTLGAPGPENLSSPVNRNGVIALLLLDPQQPSSSAPNRVRDLAGEPSNNSTFGTLSIRRKVVNNTSGDVTRLRFRVVEITTFPAPLGTTDLRVRTSNDTTVTLTDGTSALVRGLTLEEPPSQPAGGGYNSTLSAGMVTLAQPLAPGASFNVQFLLGVQQRGAFRIFVLVEALP